MTLLLRWMLRLASTTDGSHSFFMVTLDHKSGNIHVDYDVCPCCVLQLVEKTKVGLFHKKDHTCFAEAEPTIGVEL